MNTITLLCPSPAHGGGEEGRRSAPGSFVEWDRSPPTTAGTKRTGTHGGRPIESDMVRNTKQLGNPRNSASRPTSSYQVRAVEAEPSTRVGTVLAGGVPAGEPIHSVLGYALHPGQSCDLSQTRELFGNPGSLEPFAYPLDGITAWRPQDGEGDGGSVVVRAWESHVHWRRESARPNRVSLKIRSPEEISWN